MPLQCSDRTIEKRRRDDLLPIDSCLAQARKREKEDEEEEGIVEATIIHRRSLIHRVRLQDRQLTRKIVTRVILHVRHNVQHSKHLPLYLSIPDR